MNKGIALISLTVTIMVMIVLASAMIYSSNILDTAKTQLILTNMNLIYTKVSIINEKVLFEGEQNKQEYYVGLRLKDQTNKNEIAGSSLTDEQLEDENYYIYNRETLDSLGLEGIELDEGEVYIVNYVTLDIIYPKGCIGLDGNIKYTLSELIEET